MLVEETQLLARATDAKRGTTIGRARLDGSGVNQRFITGAYASCGVAIG